MDEISINNLVKNVILEIMVGTYRYTGMFFVFAFGAFRPMLIHNTYNNKQHTVDISLCYAVSCHLLQS
jgi:hypothetical protein